MNAATLLALASTADTAGWDAERRESLATAVARLARVVDGRDKLSTLAVAGRMNAVLLAIGCESCGREFAPSYDAACAMVGPKLSVRQPGTRLCLTACPVKRVAKASVAA